MKSKILFAVLLLMGFCLKIFAEDICVNGLYYQITSDSTAKVVKSADNSLYTREIVIPTTIENSEKTYKVTCIDVSAFSGAYQVTNIVIGDNVDSICASAFVSCSYLESITFGKNVKHLGLMLFDNCNNLKTIIWNAKHCNDFDKKHGGIYSNGGYIEKQFTTFIIGEDVEYLPYTLCQNMTGLKEIVLPNSVKEIGTSAFYGCTALEKVSLAEGLEKIGASAFQNCYALTGITLPNSLIEIGKSAFNGCSSISSFNVPQNVQSIGQGCIQGCSSISTIKWEAKRCPDFEKKTSFLLSQLGNNMNTQIESFELGESVEYIPAYLCNGLTEIVELTIPNSVKAIGSYAFADWRALRHLNMSVNVDSIGEHAFENCIRLDEILLPTTISYVGEDAFKNTGWANGTDGWENGVRYLNTVLVEAKTDEIGTICNVKANTTSIAAKAFYECKNLTTVTLPESLVSIGEWAFYNCANLHQIIIPDNVKVIEKGAFYNCSKLSSVEVGKKVEKIGSFAFEGCSTLNKVIIKDLTNWCNITFGNEFSYQKQGYTSNPLCYAGHLFLGNEEIIRLTIPEDVTTIKQIVFHGCDGITSVVIPNTLKRIGKSAFTNCNHIERVDVRDLSAWCTMTIESNPLQGAKLFNNDVEIVDLIIPNDVNNITANAFINCLSIKHVKFNDNLQEIGASAFYACPLEEVYLPDKIIKIGESAFSKCTYLRKATLGVELNEIAKYAFSECTALESVDLSDSLHFIGAYAFSGCSKLESIHMNPSLQEIQSYAFRKCSNLKEIEFPRDLVYVWENAFSECGIENVKWNAKNCEDFSYLYDNAADTPFYNHDVNMSKPSTDLRGQIKYITFGHEVKHIPDHLCHGLKEIKTITIGNNVESIGEGAFIGCTNLESLVLGNSVKEIGDKICQSCSKLISIYSYLREPPVVDENTFGVASYKGTDLYVPYGCKNTYLDADIWKEFYLIEGLPDAQEDGIFYMLDSEKYTAEIVHAPAGYSSKEDLDSLIIPHSIICDDRVYAVKSVRNSAFKNSKLKGKVFLPKSIVSIGDSAFYGTDITYIYSYDNSGKMKNNIKTNSTGISECLSVGNYAFAECKQLVEVKLYTCIDEIKEYAFKNDINLIALHLSTETPPIISSNVFEGCKLLNQIDLYVPEDLLTTYSSANVWKEFNIKREATYYTVVFLDWNETVIDSQEIEEGQDAIEPAVPSRDGYMFTGWDVDFTNVQSNIIVHALYEPYGTHIENVPTDFSLPHKFIREGKIYIFRDNRIYTLQGQELR